MRVVAKKEKIRIDQYLSDVLELSRSKIQKLIKEKKVKLNGSDVVSSYKLNLNDVIEVEEDKNSITIEGEDIEIDIVYEDDYLLVINKKSGMVVHPGAGNYSHTLVNALVGRYNMKADSNHLRPGIVHRIDKDTSGLMVVALDDKTLELLSEMIKNKEVERKYLALVSGVIKHDTGCIDAPIGRDIKNRQKMMVTANNSKNAITHFRVLKRFKNHTLIECKLDTGRTHQIRVHMNYIGHAICNDPVYGKSKKTTEFGQMLHSVSIRFIHPITGKEIYYRVDPPKEFNDFLEELEEVS